MARNCLQPLKNDIYIYILIAIHDCFENVLQKTIKQTNLIKKEENNKNDIHSYRK